MHPAPCREKSFCIHLCEQDKLGLGFSKQYLLLTPQVESSEIHPLEGLKIYC